MNWSHVHYRLGPKPPDMSALVIGIRSDYAHARVFLGMCEHCERLHVERIEATRKPKHPRNGNARDHQGRTP